MAKPIINANEDRFYVMDDGTINWAYFNPADDVCKGQFVFLAFDKDDLYNVVVKLCSRRIAMKDVYSELCSVGTQEFVKENDNAFEVWVNAWEQETDLDKKCPDGVREEDLVDVLCLAERLVNR